MKDSILDEILNEMMIKRRNFCMNNDRDPVIRIYVSRKVMYDLMNVYDFMCSHTAETTERKLHGYDVIVMYNDGYHICVEHPDL